VITKEEIEQARKPNKDTTLAMSNYNADFNQLLDFILELKEEIDGNLKDNVSEMARLFKHIRAK